MDVAGKHIVFRPQSWCCALQTAKRRAALAVASVDAGYAQHVHQRALMGKTAAKLAQLLLCIYPAQGARSAGTGCAGFSYPRSAPVAIYAAGLSVHHHGRLPTPVHQRTQQMAGTRITHRSSPLLRHHTAAWRRQMHHALRQACQTAQARGLIQVAL